MEQDDPGAGIEVGECTIPQGWKHDGPAAGQPLKRVAVHPAGRIGKLAELLEQKKYEGLEKEDKEMDTGTAQHSVGGSDKAIARQRPHFRLVQRWMILLERTTAVTLV
jgi:hypothetical protein